MSGRGGGKRNDSVLALNLMTPFVHQIDFFKSLIKGGLKGLTPKSLTLRSKIVLVVTLAKLPYVSVFEHAGEVKSGNSLKNELNSSLNL